MRKCILPVVLISFAPGIAAAQSIHAEPGLNALFGIVGRIHNIDPELLKAIAEAESSGDPLSVSPKGALGLMQLMPATADTFVVRDPFDPIESVKGAAGFLDYLRNRFANNPNLEGVPVLLAAYNAGPRAVEKYGGIPPYTETQNYVRRVLGRYANNMNAQTAEVPVLILTPKPFVIRLKRGAPMNPEPVLLDNDDESALKEVTAVRDRRGYLIAFTGRGTRPQIRRPYVRDHREVWGKKANQQAAAGPDVNSGEYLR